MWAIVPLKAPALAKSRLAAVLAPSERRRWFFEMARRVIDALHATPGIERVAVVTADAQVAEFARALGATVLGEPRPGGTAQAFVAALDQLRPRALRGVLMVAGDLPLASPAALQTLVEAARTHEVVVVPDRLRRGTNALACSPPDAIAPCFGENSHARHLAAAAQAGRRACTLQLDELALDIDAPGDLEYLHRLQRERGLRPLLPVPPPPEPRVCA